MMKTDERDGRSNAPNVATMFQKSQPVPVIGVHAARHARMPRKCIGKKVTLKPMNISQKFTCPASR